MWGNKSPTPPGFRSKLRGIKPKEILINAYGAEPPNCVKTQKIEMATLYIALLNHIIKQTMLYYGSDNDF
jgi:hypothetical protein